MEIYSLEFGPESKGLEWYSSSSYLQYIAYSGHWEGPRNPPRQRARARAFHGILHHLLTEEVVDRGLSTADSKRNSSVEFRSEQTQKPQKINTQALESWFMLHAL